jgi:hypothetical protein
MKENRRVVTEETVVGGVDTHKDVHVAAVLSDTGALLGWMRSFGGIGSAWKAPATTGPG